MASNPLSQAFHTQAPYGDLTAPGSDAHATGLTFQEFGATQDNYLAFAGYSQSQKQEISWTDPTPQLAKGSSATGDPAYDIRVESVAAISDGLNNQLRFVEGFDEEDGNQAPQPPPEHACSYCGISNPACVVKCLSTGRWFCNGRVNKQGSCIVLHLVKSKNKEVQLHRDSPLGDTVLECYSSGTRNVFVLGFVPVRSENTVVLLSRDISHNAAGIKDLQVDLSQWQPVIEGRAFVDWLVKTPPEEALRSSRRLTMEQITRLEEIWKTKPNATLEDLDQPVDEGEVQPVVLRYADAAQYQSVFKALIKMEADYDKAMKESQSRDDITVRWDWGLNKKRIAFFYFLKDDTELKVLPGDELRLRHRSPGGRGAWEGVGHVLPITGSEEVALEMRLPDVPEDTTVGYTVEFVWQATTYDRMRAATATFRDYSASISGHLFHLLLGHEVAPVTLRIPLPKAGFSAPSLPELNHSQIHAVKSVLQQPLSLIQGPPGTGKTVTSATIVYHLAQAGTGQVLVAAPSNIAVDQLAEKVAATGLKVVRVCAKTREAVASPVEHLTLHYQVAHLKVPQAELFHKLTQLRLEKGGLTVADEKQHRTLRRTLEAAVLEAADVVCTTCVGAGDPRVAGLRFQHVLVDESTQASEPECLLPLVLGAKQIVLVGDHCQLGPVIMCKRAAEAGLQQSLFERLRLLGIKPIRLQVQYRMHPALSEWPSNTFYEGTLQNGAGVADRRLRGLGAFPWPNPDRPIMFWAQLGGEEMSGSGTSYLNRAEAAAVEKLITRLLQSGINPDQVAVITPYEGQRAHVTATMLRAGALRQELYRSIEVSSVDAFQGREKDFIVVSCVRSNEQQGIGFLSDPRRLNVALTRARYGLVILGNPRVLSRQPLWNALLDHCKQHGALVEGPLANLKPSLMQLARPRGAFDRASFGVGALTTNRYQPPERVGDPLPSQQGPAGGAPNSSAPTATSSAAPSTSGRPTRSDQPPASRPPRGATVSSFASQATPFLPFAAPSYAIPPADYRTLSAAAASFAGPSPDAQNSASFKPQPAASLPSQSDTPATPAISDPLTQLGGATSFGGPTQASQATTFPASFVGPSGQGDYSGRGFSQMSFGFGGGMDDFAGGQTQGAYESLLSQGFGETQFLDPATGQLFGAAGATQDG